MKILNALFFILLATISTLSAQSELGTDQWTFVQKTTADWCPKCGIWGWEFKTKLLEAHQKDNTIIWSAHNSGGLANETAKALSENYGGYGQPIFFVNNENIGLRSSNVNEILHKVNEDIEAAKTVAARAVCNVIATYQNDKLTVTAKTQANETLEGAYSLGLYLVAKETVAYQASLGDNAKHKNLVVDHFGNNVFGESIDLSTANNIIELSYDIDFTDKDFTNYYVVALVWKEENGKYAFVNGYKTAIEQVSAVSNTYLSDTKLTLTQVSSNEITVNIEVSNKLENPSIQVINATGEVIASKNLNAILGRQSVSVPVTHNAKGIYFVRLISGAKSISTKYLQY